jgi:hypothetical protein
MRRKSVLMAAGIFLLAVCAVLGGLALLAKHEPGFYTRAAVPPGKIRQAHSRAFWGEYWQLHNAIMNKESQWYSTFTEAQINSFFEEDFLKPGFCDKLLPDGVTEPRIAIEQDRIRLGFRYGTPPWSTIISVNFRVWVAAQECNTVVLELQSLHAGALPVSAQSLLDQLSETLRKRNIEVTWYRHNGNPAAVLRFQSEQARPSVQLQQLELRPGVLTVAGKSIDPVAAPSRCPPEAPRK